MPTWMPPPLPAPLAAAGRDALVGRRDQLDQLDGVWELVADGSRQTVFVAGAPGSGKSRLIAELARVLHAQDVTVLLGASSPDLDAPYQPFAAALDHLLVGTGAGDLADVLPPAAGVLGGLTPNVARHVPSAAEPDRTTPGYRRELFDAYATVLDAIAEDRPVVLVLEDLHWASPPTLSLLGHLVRAPRPVPLLLVGTLRDTAPDRSPELAATIAEAYRAPNVHRIDLGGLDTAEIAAFVAAEGDLAPHAVDEAAALLARQTGGNPFFLRELWREVRRSGDVAALAAGVVATPRTVQDALEARLARLGAREWACLELGAVAGDTFHVGDVATAGGLDRTDVLEALDPLGAYGLIRFDPTAGTFAFQHELVRRAVLDRLSPSRSATLHARVAEAVEARAAGRPELAALLARLYDGAQALGYESQRVRYLTAAAEWAGRNLAHEEAADLWERAARVVAADRDRAEGLLLEAAGGHVRAGSFPAARRLYDDVATSLDERRALRAAVGFEEASWRPGHDGTRAVELLTAALDRVGERDDDPLRIRALAGLARAHAFRGDLRTAGRIGSQAVHLARDLGDEDVLADALVASNLHTITTPDTVAAQHQRAIELRRLAVATGDLDKLGPAGTYLALTSYVGGDPSGWEQGRADVARAAAATGQPFWEWVVGCHEFGVRFLAGDFAAAEEAAERNRLVGETFGSDDTEGPYGIQIFLVRRETGALETIRPLISGDPDEVGDAWPPGLLAIYTELGLADAAQRLLRRVVADFDATRQSATWPAVLAFAADAAITLGDTGTIGALERLLADYSGFNLVVGPFVAALGSADLLLARIAAQRGDGTGAERHFEAALDMDRRMGARVHQAETLARFARFLIARDRAGDGRRAVAYAAEARTLAQPRGQRRVLELLGADAAEPDLPDGLTLRELDVIRLLAEGASNREIGERLFISEHTAANHVRSILMKTGASNRTQAAIYASDRGLLSRSPAAPPSRPGGRGPRPR